MEAFNKDVFNQLLLIISISGESRHGLYNTNRKHHYNRGHVAQCSKCTAISLTVFIFSVIFLSSLSLAFIRPFDFSQECPKGGLGPVFIPTEEDYDPEYEEDDEIIATNGETFPWDDIRLPAFINPVRYDIELTPNLTSLWVKGMKIYLTDTVSVVLSCTFTK